MASVRDKSDQISLKDCPTEIAPHYPGAFSKDNPSGSLESRNDFLRGVVKSWVSHFKYSRKYENTSLSKKTDLLLHYLKNFRNKRFGWKQAAEILAKIEAEDKVEEVSDVQDSSGSLEANTTNVQNIEDMQVEFETGNDLESYTEKNTTSFNSSESSSSSSSENEDSDNNETDIRSNRETELKKYLDLPDSKLFSDEIKLPHFIELSRRYQKRRAAFISSYLEEKEFENSQEVLETFSQNPIVVQTSSEIKTKQVGE